MAKGTLGSRNDPDLPRYAGIATFALLPRRPTITPGSPAWQRRTRPGESITLMCPSGTDG